MPIRIIIPALIMLLTACVSKDAELVRERFATDRYIGYVIESRVKDYSGESKQEVYRSMLQTLKRLGERASTAIFPIYLRWTHSNVLVTSETVQFERVGTGVTPEFSMIFERHFVMRENRKATQFSRAVIRITPEVQIEGRSAKVLMKIRAVDIKHPEMFTGQRWGDTLVNMDELITFMEKGYIEGDKK